MKDALLAECMAILDETLASLLEDVSADDRITLLVAVRDRVVGMLDELTED